MKERTLPTQRLSEVIVEGTEALTALANLRRALAQVVKEWGLTPQEVVLDELRNLLDENPQPAGIKLAEATAYLKLHGNKLKLARNAQRRQRGLEPSDFVPEFGEDTNSVLPEFKPILTIEDIEEKLKSLPTLPE